MRKFKVGHRYLAAVCTYSSVKNYMEFTVLEIGSVMFKIKNATGDWWHKMSDFERDSAFEYDGFYVIEELKEIVEKEPFVWDDAMVKEYVEFSNSSLCPQAHHLNIPTFKRMKETSTPQPSTGSATAKAMVSEDDESRGTGKIRPSFSDALKGETLFQTPTADEVLLQYGGYEFAEWASHSDWTYVPSKKLWYNEEDEENIKPLTTKELVAKFKLSSVPPSKPLNSEWEIVAFVNEHNEVVEKNIFTESVFEKKNLNIHSVKRLSDGEVFTVGDEVNWSLPEHRGEKPFKITSFQINKMLPNRDRMFCNNQNMDIVYLTKTSPVPSQPQNNKEEKTVTVKITRDNLYSISSIPNMKFYDEQQVLELEKKAFEAGRLIVPPYGPYKVGDLALNDQRDTSLKLAYLTFDDYKKQNIKP